MDEAKLREAILSAPNRALDGLFAAAAFDWHVPDFGAEWGTHPAWTNELAPALIPRFTWCLAPDAPVTTWTMYTDPGLIVDRVAKQRGLFPAYIDQLHELLGLDASVYSSAIELGYHSVTPPSVGSRDEGYDYLAAVMLASARTRVQAFLLAASEHPDLRPSHQHHFERFQEGFTHADPA